MLRGLNSYLKSKDILLMTAELRPLGIQGNLVNWKLEAKLPRTYVDFKSCSNTGVSRFEAQRTFFPLEEEMIGDKRNRYLEIGILKVWMVIYTLKTYIHPPNFNLAPQKSSSTMLTSKCHATSSRLYSFTHPKSPTSACHETDMHKGSYFVLAVLILIS